MAQVAWNIAGDYFSIYDNIPRYDQAIGLFVAMDALLILGKKAIWKQSLY